MWIQVLSRAISSWCMMTNFHCYFLRSYPISEMNLMRKMLESIMSNTIRASIMTWDTDFAPRCSKAAQAKLRASGVKSDINQPTSNWPSLNLPRIIFHEIKRTQRRIHFRFYADSQHFSSICTLNNLHHQQNINILCNIAILLH